MRDRKEYFRQWSKTPAGVAKYKRQRERRKLKYKTDPEYRAKILARKKAFRSTPEGYASDKASKRRTLSDPVHREVKREAHRRWKKTEKGRKYNREWARKNYHYAHHVKSTYGLSFEEYESLAASGCHICGKKDNGKRRLFVDHCHRTGKVRGALCNGCNLGLGGFKEKPELMLLAIKYLEKHNA